MAAASSGGGGEARLAVMVNSCFGKMGNAVAMSVVKAGVTLVPYSFNSSEGVVAVEGVSVKLVPNHERDEVTAGQLISPCWLNRCLLWDSDPQHLKDT